MKTKSKFFVLLLLYLVFVSFQQIGVVKAEHNTFVVPDDYPTIQQAIDNSAVGDIIYVKKGIYHENLEINKPLALIGENRDETIIDGNTSQNYRVPINIKNSNIAISGFTLSYGYAGIQIGEVQNCNISGNKITNADYGIRCFKSSQNNISENIFEAIRGGTIRLSLSTQNMILKNYFSSCIEGVQLTQSSNYNTVSRNTITDCEDVGIRLQESDWNTITDNTIKNNEIGISIYIANTNFITNNNFINNSLNAGADEWYARQWGYGYSLNSWNENYWSDYNGTDNNGDGLGDTPYEINESNKDGYPLMDPTDVPVLIPEFPSWATLPLLFMTTFVVTFYILKFQKLKATNHFLV